ncbi:hypothetical protein L2E82_06010 [Cichorium intybus]|uniref:Uncharacterized protein n=1 Tax=Cichorium intybus TaxID=13427 RepID=A0ACB9HAD5_CICIN|nr:hypothetical protein L2E82_06010 [Cichorium intybus]
MTDSTSSDHHQTLELRTEPLKASNPTTAGEGAVTVGSHSRRRRRKASNVEGKAGSHSRRRRRKGSNGEGDEAGSHSCSVSA